MTKRDDLLTVKEASEWATHFLGKAISPANISYLIQYGRIKKIGDNGSTQILKQDLINYYLGKNKEASWKNQLGDDLNWALSFDQYREVETTKHVHRLHPYKGKFIPQLVEYFIDSHTDEFKSQQYFKKNDIILDPFSGSGTTMVEANEQGINAIGIDISIFNTLISNSKILEYDLVKLQHYINDISKKLKEFLSNTNTTEFEDILLKKLNEFNNIHFKVPNYKYDLHHGIIEDELKNGIEKENLFLPIYTDLVEQYKIHIESNNTGNFLNKWYMRHVIDEINVVYDEIKKIEERELKDILCIILSRTIRSCRATTHSDLATLINPVTTTYYCSKHGKICKPIFSILKWWSTYSKDTIKRLVEFNKIRTDTYQVCLNGDSRHLNIIDELSKVSNKLYELTKEKKIKGIILSPPYVGIIDYHEQHAYAYDLFNLPRKDDLEIGPLYKGQRKEAKESYIKGISEVLNNCKKYLANDYDIFLVANDKYNMYPTIAENSGMQIVNQFKRPVLNRTEKDKRAYSETIFHLKKKERRTKD
ncbi:MAG: hypothetical protein JWN78_1999 [Bacteroidota bacterium]|nr:hypothetical protein [Bacteroidota bacterium]